MGMVRKEVRPAWKGAFLASSGRGVSPARFRITPQEGVPEWRIGSNYWKNARHIECENQEAVSGVPQNFSQFTGAHHDDNVVAGHNC